MKSPEKPLQVRVKGGQDFATRRTIEKMTISIQSTRTEFKPPPSRLGPRRQSKRRREKRRQKKIGYCLIASISDHAVPLFLFRFPFFLVPFLLHYRAISSEFGGERPMEGRRSAIGPMASRLRRHNFCGRSWRERLMARRPRQRGDRDCYRRAPRRAVPRSGEMLRLSRMRVAEAQMMRRAARRSVDVGIV